MPDERLGVGTYCEAEPTESISMRHYEEQPTHTHTLRLCVKCAQAYHRYESMRDGAHHL